MGWWDGVRSLVGTKAKSLDQMSTRDLQEVKRGLDMGVQKLERQLDRNEQEQQDAAKAVLAAGSHARKIVAMERLKGVKNQGKMIAKAFVVRSRYVQGIDSILVLKQALGEFSADLSAKLDTLNPEAIGDYLATLGDDLSRSSFDSDAISRGIEELTADTGNLVDGKDLAEIESLQDSFIDNPELSEEEKIRRLLES